MVYVISENGQPLMPTMRYGKVRRMLNTNKATVVKRCPFTIRLCYESAAHTQPISLGVDAGGKTVGLIIGYKCDEAIKDAFAYGADKVIVMDNEVYDHYSTDAYTAAIVHAVEKNCPYSMAA